MDDLIQQASAALRAGNKEEARKLLKTALQQNPNNERAWGWMYNAADSNKERIDCLKQMVRINPKNEKAQTLLNELTNLEPPLEMPKQSINTTTSAPKKVDNKAFFLGASVICIVLICCVVIFANLGVKTKDYKSMAFVMCQLYVQNRLKAPSTAEFATSSNSNIQDLGNNTFEILSHVDAQNSFGAVLRTNYYCKIQYIGDASNDESQSRFWKLIDLQINE